eukprot:RCo004243
MVSLKLQHRLAASILKVGRGRVWLDPNETSDISLANSRTNVKKLIKDGYIIRKPVKMHTRARWRRMQIAKKKGRHCGPGHRHGTREARFPTRLLWMRRLRVLRRLLKRYRAAKKLDVHFYRLLYRKVKGGVFKNKRQLMEHIHKTKAARLREKTLKDQVQAKKLKKQAEREKIAGRELKRKEKEKEKAREAKAKQVQPEAPKKAEPAKKGQPAKKPEAKTSKKAEPAKKAEVAKKPEAKAAKKPEAKPEAKAAKKPEAKAAKKPEAKAAKKPEAKAAKKK